MRVAQVASPSRSILPVGYGETRCVVSLFTQELLDMGGPPLARTDDRVCS
jgi:hypothetical protein